jgi:hypothetical protein
MWHPAHNAHGDDARARPLMIGLIPQHHSLTALLTTSFGAAGGWNFPDDAIR